MSKKMVNIRLAVTAVAALSVLTVAPASAQRLYAYPTKGQSQQQQQKDKAECSSWAIAETGYNPETMRFDTTYSAPPPSRQSGFFGRGEYGEGGGLADAGKGAAGGALIGAIAGDAGKGAAIGAVSGILIGGIRRSDREYERRQWEEQQAAQHQVQENQRSSMQREWNRAFASCMVARGYNVQ